MIPTSTADFGARGIGGITTITTVSTMDMNGVTGALAVGAQRVVFMEVAGFTAAADTAVEADTGAKNRNRPCQ